MTEDTAPVTDAEELGKIMHEAAQDAFAASMDGERTHLGTIRVKRFPWERVSLDVQRRMVAEAAAVRDAVVPPKTHIVVPRAEHDALMKRAESLTTRLTFRAAGRAVVNLEVFEAFWDAFVDYSTALGEEEPDADA